MAKLAARSPQPARTDTAQAPVPVAKRVKAAPSDAASEAPARRRAPVRLRLASEGSDPVSAKGSGARPRKATTSGKALGAEKALSAEKAPKSGKGKRAPVDADPATAGEDLATLSSAPRLDPQRSLEKALGAQVRQLRRDRDLSLGDLAAAAGLSSGMMSKIENGQISPSLSTINALAGALHVPFTSLFAAFEEKRDCSFVAAGTGNRIDRRGTKAGHVYQLIGKVLGGEVSVEPYFITLEADAVPYAGFRHAGVELIYMLTGEVVYRHGDECYTLKPGDTLLFDSGALHGPERLITVPMTYLSIIVYPRQQGQ